MGKIKGCTHGKGRSLVVRIAEEFACYDGVEVCGKIKGVGVLFQFGLGEGSLGSQSEEKDFVGEHGSGLGKGVKNKLDETECQSFGEEASIVKF